VIEVLDDAFDKPCELDVDIGLHRDIDLRALMVKAG